MSAPSSPGKVRLDELVQRQCRVSLAKAQGLIRTGKVTDKNGVKLDRPSAMVSSDAAIRVDEGPRYVSRGGLKLEAALDSFEIDVSGLVTIDVGASTGGFTDCLLQRGASRVYAVDVGYGQLDWRLRQDPRVVVMERTNVRHLNPDQLADRPEFFTVDCSFISLRVVLPSVAPLLSERASGVVLIKPQFEAERDEVTKGGVVRDSDVHDRVVAEVRETAESIGFEVRGVISSPLKGPAGNKEFLAYLARTR